MVAWWKGGGGGDTKKREEESEREKTPRRKRPNSGIRLGGVRLLRAKKGKEVLEIVDFRIIEITSEMEVLIRIWEVGDEFGISFSFLVERLKILQKRAERGWLATHLSNQNLILEPLPKEWWKYGRRKKKNRRDTFSWTVKGRKVKVPWAPTHASESRIYSWFRSPERTLFTEIPSKPLTQESLITLKDAISIATVFVLRTRNDIPLYEMRLRLRIASPKKLFL